ncbi:MAG: DUF3108 domain-containing protein [Roseovarius sp.]
MRLALTALIALLALPVEAEEQTTMRYDVRLLGARVGVMTIAATEKNGYYAARSRFSTAGIVGALKSLSADVSVQGRVAGDALRPQAYSEEIHDGSRVSNVKVRFAPGTPRLMEGDPGSDAPPANPASLGAAIDPLTVLYAALRDQPRAEVCRFSADVFDGHRLARLALTRPAPEGERVTCHGFYKRLEGYGNDRENRNVPVSVEYEPVGGEMRAARVRVETKYGMAVMDRR